MSTDPSKKPPGNRRRYQFTLATLLFIVLPISILAGTWAGLLDLGAPAALRAVHLLVAAAAPMGILVALGLVRAILRSKGPPRE